MIRTVACCLLLAALLFPVAASAQSEDEIRALAKFVEENGYHYTVGRTSVSGLTEQQREKLCGLSLPANIKEIWESLPRFVPSRSLAGVEDPLFDWRALGGMTSVKNQGSCGACWSFNSVGMLESFMRIYDGVILDLSEQYYIDCNEMGDDCDGGWYGTVMAMMQDYGAVSESCIPYKGTDGFACTVSSCRSIARIRSAVSIANNVDAIKEALLTGPVITVFKTHSSFYTYTGGCYDHDESLYDPDHGIIIVGWDDDACGGSGAWICKNSWGADWGIDGYFYGKYGVSLIGMYAVQVVYDPFATLSYPLGGEKLNIGETAFIRWNVPQIQPDSVSIHLGLGEAGPFDQLIAGGITGASSYSWNVPDIQTETAYIRVTAWLDGSVRAIDQNDAPFAIGLGNVVRQSYPNPFFNKTVVAYSIGSPSKVTVKVFDIAGRLLKVLFDDRREAGSYTAEWDGTDGNGNNVASGTYFCRIETGSMSETRKIVLIR